MDNKRKIIYARRLASGFYGFSIAAFALNLKELGIVGYMYLVVSIIAAIVHIYLGKDS